MLSIELERKHVESLVEGRKMLASEVIKSYEFGEDKVLFKSFNDLKELSDKLAVPLKDFFVEDDLDQGVKISRKDEGFSRTIERNGVTYYTYNHLVTTKNDSSLMALRLDLHCNDIDQISLNGGHGSKEVIYVTRGKVRMDWETKEGNRHAELNVGDSVYVSPGISHSFIAIDGDSSEVIAINY
ncbi:MAG: hypothetical protein K2Y08_07110 [Alphaproteobacteria bacterium]|nr:hypothetical protein [Alphaproteobacteria bacterium]